MLKKDSICSQILTPKQYGPICWFMALFVAMFYSQRNRKILLKASKNWDQNNELFKTLYNVLHNKYLKKSVNGEDYDDFSDDTFIKILSLLFQEDKKLFPFNPEHEKMLKAFSPQLYIGKLYTLLGIDYKMFDYNKKNNILRYSFLNKEYDDLLILKIKKEKYSDYVINDGTTMILKDHKYMEDEYAPPILIVMVHNNYEYPIYESILSNNVIPNDSKNSNIRYRNDNVTYNKKNYTLDSVVLFNSNTEDNNGHIISGITCEDKRYIYNGWIKKTTDASKGITRDIPCELMPYNWNIMFDNYFCLNTQNCIPDILKTKVEKGNFCFNFSQGTRILIYVRDDAKSETSKESSSPQTQNDKKNPNAVELSSVESKGGKNIRNTISRKSPKKCPKGKVLNPKTGRYINKKPYKKGGGNTCSKILTPIQVGPTCWFMATFVAMFYSQRSRKLLLEASKTWGDGGNDRLFRFLRHILNNRYLKEGEDIENYKKFSDEFFNTILELLYNKNKDIFPYNPKDILDGFYSDIYLPRLYKLLNIDYKIFDYINYNLYDTYTYTYENKNELSYSYFNKEYDNILKFEINDKKSLKINIEKSTKKLNEYILEKDKNKFEYVEDGEAPPILIIRHWKIGGIIDPKMSEEYNLLISKKIIYTDKVPLLYTNVPGEVPDVPDVSVPVEVPVVYTDVKDDKKELYNELTSMKDKITYNNQEYRLDSIILHNYNYSSNNHAICGITCKNKKYIYNGWTGISNDPSITQNITRNIPCGLMKYDWDTKKDKDFTIFPNKCEPIILKYKDIKDTLYFNFSKTPKFLIYVRKNATTENSEEHSPPRRSPPSYSSLYPTLYPKLYPTVNPTPYYPPPPEPQLPEGWERRIAYNGNIFYRNNNNNTEQWNFPSEGGTKKKSTGKKSIHNKKSAKKPPEGKVLNPKTGRYILIKNALNKNEVKSKSPKKCPKGKVLNPKTGRYILIKK
jgi:hypothetical protein